MLIYLLYLADFTLHFSIYLHQHKDTAIHRAAKHSYREMVAILIDKNARLDLLNEVSRVHVPELYYACILCTHYACRMAILHFTWLQWKDMQLLSDTWSERVVLMYQSQTMYVTYTL